MPLHREEIIPGVTYIHYKGGNYRVLTIARDSEDPDREIVVYESLSECKGFPAGTRWTRGIDDFLGIVDLEEGKRVPRFSPK